MAAPWTNRAQSVFVPLNDYTATVVGMVRDNVPFNTLLSADLIYIARRRHPARRRYSPANNDMYQAMDDNNVDLKAHLVPSTQSALTGIPSAATAGVMTTRGAASAFFVNGTNRAMFRFTMMNHLCSDLPTVMDTTRPPDRIRQDVTRSPGGVSTLFLTNCIGCHSGMDPMAQAFAYYNFDVWSTTYSLMRPVRSSTATRTSGTSGRDWSAIRASTPAPRLNMTRKFGNAASSPGAGFHTAA